MPSTSGPPQFVLASASPRRAALLEQLGLAFSVRATDLDERQLPTESAEEMVRRLALAKSSAIARETALPVLGADTAVTIDGAILGNPAERVEGLAMLATLSGRTHQVLTAIAIVHGARAEVRVSRSRVTFRQISRAEA